MKKSKNVGILGGMGPYATLFFFQTLLENTPAKKDWDHAHIIIDCNPHIPSRSRHHIFHECTPVPAMIESCKKLELYPVDFITIPCNSACAYLPEIQKEINVPILNIIEITVESLVQKYPNVKKIAVLGGIITYDLCTYEPYLTAFGLHYVHHSPYIQRKIEKIIEAVKINEPFNKIKNDFIAIVDQIQVENEVDVIILGCTELIKFSSLHCSMPLVDSNKELALKTIELAFNMS